MLATPSAYRTKREVATARLRDAIIRGELQPGTRLLLQELANQFELSLTPVREALQNLEAEGFVHQSPHKGAIVAGLDRDEVMELYAIRRGVEGLATREGVPKLGASDLAELESALHDLEAFAGEWAGFVPLDRHFHSIIYRGAGSRRWLETIESLWQRSVRYMFASAITVGRGDLDQDHRRLLAACRAGDALTAEAIVHEHLDRSQQELLRTMSASLELGGSPP